VHIALRLASGEHAGMRWLARVFMRLRGWSYLGAAPDIPRYIVVGAPHTSNWDFVVVLAATSHFGIDAKVIGKDTLVKGPLGGLMRRLGIIPVRRDTGQGMVEQMAAAFAAADELALVIAPEGTRKSSPYWRSGFYQIAVAANVPLLLTRVDGADRTAELGPLLYPSGDTASDMDIIRHYYAGARGINAGRESTVRLRDEDAAR